MPAVSQFMRGNKVVVSAEFRVPDSTGTLTDPATVTYTAKERNGAATAYVYGTAPEVTKTATGKYELAFVPAEGSWSVHVQGTGSAYAADEVSFTIDHSRALA